MNIVPTNVKIVGPSITEFIIVLAGIYLLRKIRRAESVKA